MDNKLMTLFEQLGIEGQLENFKYAKIQKVGIGKNSGLFTFIMETDIAIPCAEFEIFVEALKKFPQQTELIMKANNVEYIEDEVKAYLNFVIRRNPSLFAIFNNLPQNTIVIEDHVITFELMNEVQLQAYRKLANDLAKELSRCGLRYSIDFVVEEDSEVFKEIMEEFEKPVVHEFKTYQPEANVEVPSEKKVFRRADFGPKQSVLISEIEGEAFNIQVEGYIFQTDLIKTRNQTHIQTLMITDYSDSISIKLFETKTYGKEQMDKFAKGKQWVRVTGDVRMDSYSRELSIFGKSVEVIDGPIGRVDTSEVKRVELHTHTQMSTMDGIGTISEYASQAAKWGHKAIAVTDHGNVQSFPEAQQAAKNNKLKMIYGIEAYMVDIDDKIVYNAKPDSLKGATYVCFDLETTGLSVVNDGITEFGAVKMKDGLVIDRMQSFVNPERIITEKIINLTSITNEMVRNAPTIKDLLPRILDFIKDSVLVAHNAVFDIGFLNYYLELNGYSSLTNQIVDTLPLARAIIETKKGFSLGRVCRNYKIAYDEDIAHRADYDAEVLSDAFRVMLSEVDSKGYYTFDTLNNLQTEDTYKIVFPTHTTILVKNKIGLKNLFKLVSYSNIKYLNIEARMPKFLIDEYREGLIVGTSCSRSDVFEAALNSDDHTLEQLISWYDYVEVQPVEDYAYLVDRGSVASMEVLHASVKRLVLVAKKLGKIVVATGDVHYLDPKEKIFREVYIRNSNIGIGGTNHPLHDRKNAHSIVPDQHFRTTDEMIKSFAFLGDELAYELVVTNTNLIADMVEEVKPIHDKLYPPTIENDALLLTDLCYKTAREIYGDNLPDIVEKRLEKELHPIIKYGFSVMYYIAHKLVKKSLDDGYLVGSRGSVGSSFVATMSGITEVNPLPPHYICGKCKHSEFLPEGTIASGYDLDDKVCPICGAEMRGDGQNIPFETFLGFEGDKVPDIDLNFSGEYQAVAHNYTKVLFGEDKVYRAGTISTVADKTAYGYAKGYIEAMGREGEVRGAELSRLAAGAAGVKRTTGQHPGGIIVIPNEMDVYDFTPVQFPADDINSEWKTTHFDFHAIHDNVLKLDILGHVDPTVIRMLQDITGVDPKTIPTNDKKVMSLFSSSEAMGIDLSYIDVDSGALGLPEFGTTFVRGMLQQTKPKSFAELVVISGLSHGTDVYLGNAELLIRSGQCNLSEVIGCRDDIMVYLIEKGLPEKLSFDIMECVRKGKATAVFPEKKYEESMIEYNIPSWYIESCKKIKYMFPKAHAVAYVLMAIRVAWFKIYYPREYYSVYFSARTDAFEIDTMIKGKDAILRRRKEILDAKQEKKSTNKDEALLSTFEICLEMIERGYHFSPISLEYSDATRFMINPNDKTGVLPPFSCIDGLGGAAAESVVRARSEKPFISKQDVLSRTSLNNTNMDFLTRLGVFDHLQEENQLSLF